MGLMEMIARAMGATPRLVEGVTIPSGDYVDSDEALWRPITGNKRRDLNPIEFDKARRISTYLWRRNPMAHRLIEQMADFIVGDGFTLTADTDAGQRIADDVWADPVTNLKDRHRDLFRDLSIFGELAARVSVNPVAGRMRLGFIDVERIHHVDLDPENVLIDKTLFVIEGTNVEPIPIPLYVWDDMTTPGEGQWVGEGFYHAINRLTGQTRGTPDLLAIADYVDGYDQLVFNALERSSLVNAFIYEVTLEGADDSQIAAWLSKNGTAPRPGSIRAHNASEKWGVVEPALGSADTVALGRIVKNMGLGGAGVPEAWFAEGDSVNRATLVAQGDPTYRMLKARQDLCQGYVRRWVEVGIQHARGKRLSMSAAVPKISVGVPDISQKDLSGVSQALPQVATAIVSAVAEQLIDRKSGRKVFLMVASQLGVELNEQDVEKAIEEDQAQAKAEAEATNVEQALRAAAGLTPEGFPKPPVPLALRPYAGQAPGAVPKPGAVPGVQSGGPVQPEQVVTA